MSFSASAGTLWRVLAGTAYGRYTLGNLTTSSGAWMLRLSTGWLAWELTHSATWLGVLAFADLFPAIVCAPVAGVLADRMDRIVLLRRIMAAGIVVSALMAIAFYAGVLGIWTLSALCLAQGIVNSLSQPMRLTIVQELVRREDVAPAVAINAITFNIARFVGPMIAGSTIIFAGVGPTFLLNIAFIAIFLLQLRKLEGPRREIFQGGSVFANAIDGLRYLVRQGTVLSLFVQATCVGLCIRPVAELLPAVSDHFFSAGALGLTLLTASMGVGAIFGGIWFAGLPTLDRVVALISANGVISVGAVCVLILSPWLTLGIAAMMVLGFTVVSSGIASQATIQLIVDESQRGRTMSSYAMLVRAAPALGTLVIGVLAEILGLRLALALALPICLVASLILYAKRLTIQDRLNEEIPGK